MLNANQVIAVASFLNTSTDATEAWNLWMQDLATYGGDLDAAGARAFAEVHGDRRSPTAHDEAKALRRLAQLMEANQ